MKTLVAARRRSLTTAEQAGHRSIAAVLRTANKCPEIVAILERPTWIVRRGVHVQKVEINRNLALLSIESTLC